ncbi:carbohydrate binding domain-containing protein [Candidatus Poribacteria bacterium]
MIRRSFLTLFFVSVCLVFISVYPAQAQDEEFENLLQNPDLEEGDAPWSLWVEGQGNAIAGKIIDEKESHTGDHSLLISITKKGNGQRVELHQDPIVVKQGQRLTYAFWAKAEKDAIVDGMMIMNHRADPWTSYGSANIKITDEWQEFHAPINVTVDDFIAGIYIELRDSSEVQVWFDHFRLYEGDYFEEDMEGEQQQAVEPDSKLLSTWGNLKSLR